MENERSRSVPFRGKGGNIYLGVLKLVVVR